MGGYNELDVQVDKDFAHYKGNMDQSYIEFINKFYKIINDNQMILIKVFNFDKKQKQKKNKKK